jgi:xanthine dehydrogenase small subunit
VKPAVEQSGIRFHLNGSLVEARDLPVSTTLLDFIRAQGLTGTKEGCAEGECGACTVAVVKSHGSGSQYVPINSCLLLLPMASGLEIYTVERLARDGKLAEVQQAMVDCGGSQCGYCTPGFVMSLFCEQYRPGRIAACDVDALSGNLCRCTGYRPIRDAALSVGPASAGDLRDRLIKPAPPRPPSAYTHEGVAFFRPGTIAECLELLNKYPDARLVAGGTDLAVESNLRYQRFPVWIGIDALPELCDFLETPDSLRIGAGLTLSEIETQAPRLPGSFPDWVRLFASPLIRNRATLGGNLATASPIGDAAPWLLAHDAAVVLADQGGERTVALTSFFRSYRQTDLGPTEVLKAIEIPKPWPAKVQYYKIAKRRVDDISTVAACLAVTLDDAGRVELARFAYGGVAATPLRATAAEDAILGRRWDLSAVRRVKDVLAKTLQPLSDHRGSAAYRLAMAQMLVEKYWHQRAAEAA